MTREHYKSDFTRRVTFTCDGQPATVPEGDFTLFFFTDQSWRRYEAGRTGGQLRNCRLETGSGALVVTLRNHGLMPGRLQVECRAEVDTPEDGTLQRWTAQLTDTTLVSGSTGGIDTGQGRDADMTISADDLSRTAALSALEALSPEVTEARRRIRAALLKHGVETLEDAALTALADNVAALPTVAREQGGSLLEWADSRRRADLPYMAAVEYPSGAALWQAPSGAAAWLVSEDGREREVTAREGAPAGTGEYTAARTRVIAYYAVEDYAFTGAPTVTVETLLLGGRPVAVTLLEATGRLVTRCSEGWRTVCGGWDKARIVSAGGLAGGSGGDPTGSSTVAADFPDLVSCAWETLFQGYLPQTEICCPRLREVTNGRIVRTLPAVRVIRMPMLRRFAGVYLSTDSNTSLEKMELPLLETIGVGPQSAAANSSLATGNSRITRLELPALKRIEGGTVTRGFTAMELLDLPLLETISHGILCNVTESLREVRLPLLREIAGGETLLPDGSPSGRIELTVRALEACEGIVKSGQQCSGITAIHLGAPTGADLGRWIRLSANGTGRLPNLGAVTVERGFDVCLDVRGAALLDAAGVAEIVEMMADRSGRAAGNLVLGQALLATVTMETRLLAQAKNWTLS